MTRRETLNLVGGSDTVSAWWLGSDAATISGSTFCEAQPVIITIAIVLITASVFTDTHAARYHHNKHTRKQRALSS